MNIVEQLQQTLKAEIIKAAVTAQLVTEEEIPTVILERPKETEHGDYSTNLAMQLARIAKKAPRQIAEEIAANFDKDTASVEKIAIAGPGFINFYLNNAYLTNLIPQVLKADETYGETNFGRQEKIHVEFVSANPTGDLHLGHARGASVGDSLCRILAKAGYDVTREYYINDAGNQINNLAYSVEARYFQALGYEKEIPEDGYHGEDIVEIGQRLAKEFGEQYVNATEKNRFDFFREYGLKYELEKIEADLENFGVPFDVWFSETSLYENSNVKAALAVLQEKGYLYEDGGATWFRSTEFGDDKDRVLIKNDGSYTYLAPDIAYHKDKLERGYPKLINIWGADHHGYIPRMKAAIEALGYEKDTLEVAIIQLVHLFQDGERVRMSKRTGKAVTMRDLVEEVGLDAVRYFFAARSGDTHLDFDLDLAVSESNENPVYYAQYAHARICSIIRQAEQTAFVCSEKANLSLLETDKEIELLKRIGEFPLAINEAAERRLPHRITNYIHDLASAFHSFYNAEKVIDENNVELSGARLALVKSVRITLRNALTLIGVSAPESM